jgi:hypothetical protein
MYINRGSSTYVNDRSGAIGHLVARAHPLWTLSQPEPSPDLHDRIMVTIRAEAARQQRWRLFRRSAACGLAVVVSLVVIAHGGGLRKER